MPNFAAGRATACSSEPGTWDATSNVRVQPPVATFITFMPSQHGNWVVMECSLRAVGSCSLSPLLCPWPEGIRARHVVLQCNASLYPFDHLCADTARANICAWQTFVHLSRRPLVSISAACRWHMVTTSLCLRGVRVDTTDHCAQLVTCGLKDFSSFNITPCVCPEMTTLAPSVSWSVSRVKAAGSCGQILTAGAVHTPLVACRVICCAACCVIAGSQQLSGL